MTLDLSLPCKPWPGPTRFGYGVDGRTTAHIAAWEAVHGPRPPGLVLDHECHNADPWCAGGPSCPHRACTELGHLALSTIGENARRGWATRAACGRGHLWTEENTYRPPRGRRMCRACMAVRAEWRRREHGDRDRAASRERMARLYASRRNRV